MNVHPFDPVPSLLDTLILVALSDQPRHGYQITVEGYNRLIREINLLRHIVKVHDRHALRG